MRGNAAWHAKKREVILSIIICLLIMATPEKGSQDDHIKVSLYSLICHKYYVIQRNIIRRVVHLYCWIYIIKNYCGNVRWLVVRTENIRCADIWTTSHIFWQLVCCWKYNIPWFSTWEKLLFNCVTQSDRSYCFQKMFDICWTVQY